MEILLLRIEIRTDWQQFFSNNNFCEIDLNCY